jgi:hypothetical protein
MALLTASYRCLEIVRPAIRHAEVVWNFERVRQIPDEITNAIAAWSHKLVQRAQ